MTRLLASQVQVTYMKREHKGKAGSKQLSYGQTAPCTVVIPLQPLVLRDHSCLESAAFALQSEEQFSMWVVPDQSFQVRQGGGIRG
jgi:hypothetical protein